MSDIVTTKLHRRSILLAGVSLFAATAFMNRPALAITPAEIKAKGKLVVGIQGDNPPWGFVNSSGDRKSVV